MRQAAVVASREFRSTVRRRSYLIITFGMPFFITLYLALLAFVPAYMMAREGGAEIGLVDEAGVLKDASIEQAGGGNSPRGDAHTAAPADPRHVRAPAEPPGDPLSVLSDTLKNGSRTQAAGALLEKMMAPSRFLRFADRAAALEALRQGRVERFFVLPADYLARGGVDSYESDGAPAGLEGTRGQEDLERLLSGALLAGRLPSALRDRVEDPIDEAEQRTYLMDADGRLEPLREDERTARLLIPAVFGVLLLMALMTNAGYLLQGLTEEKENRVIEIILTSVRPRQLLLGKLVGLGAAGLLQLAVWTLVAGLTGAVLETRALALLQPGVFAGCVVFFVLGFLMIGSLMIGTGALGTNSRESQQLAMIWSLLATLPPLVTWLVLVREPNGLLARLLGWCPLTSPVTMMVRIGTGRVPLWDVGVAVLALVAGVMIALRVAAGLLSLGLLMYGRRPTLREAARHLRGA